MVTSSLPRPIRRVHTLFVAACAGLMLACGSDSSGPSIDITVSGFTAGSLSFVGATVQLSASSSTGSLGSIDWSSSAESVATVSGTGLVTARGAGSATITARSGGSAGSATVTVDLVPASLAAGTGNGQDGTVGAELGTMIGIEVLDQGGTPIAGKTVTFQASHGGSASPAAATTDAQGRAQTRWTLGTVAGEQTLQATSGSESFTFSAMAAAGPPAAVSALRGNGQTGLAGEALPEPIGARIEDEYGNGIAGGTVTFTVAAGSGSVSSPTAQANHEGVAEVIWTLDRYAGQKSVTATAEGVTGATFSATATPNGVIAGVASPVGTWTSPRPFSVGHTTVSSKITRTFAAFAGVEQDERLPDFLVRELLVTLASPGGPAFSRSATTAAAAQAQADVMTELSRTLPASESFEVVGASPVIRTVRLRVEPDEDLTTVANRLRTDPRVESVELNGIERAFYDAPARPQALSGLVTSTEPLYPRQAWHYESVGLRDAWRFTKGSPNIVVAVIDDGVRFDHPDLGPALLDDGFDFVTDVAVPRCTGGTIGFAGDGDGPDPDPEMPTRFRFNQAMTCIASFGGSGGHGTHVIGTIAAQEGTGGGVGVAPGVSILPVRVLGPSGSGFTYDVVQGILYAAGLPADAGALGIVQAPFGAHVINMSLGGSGASTIREAAVQAATAAGSLIIASSGNSGGNAINYPAAYPEVVSVASVGPDWNRASYSTSHSTVEVAGPGGSRGSSGLDDFGVYSSIWNFDTGTPTWDWWDGTSMAAPHVSGVAALLFSQDPGRTAAEVRALLTDYARDLGTPGRDPFYGFGLVDAAASLTQGGGVPGNTWVQLHDAMTGLPVANVGADQGGAFSFGGLADGDYFLYGGLDTFGDGFFGIPGRPWSAFGGGGSPMPLTVDGAGAQDASFSFGRAFESEPNGTPGTANTLMVGGYIEGLLDGGADVDLYRIVIAEAGSYVFETYGVFGACGFALVPDTVLDLLNAGGTLVESNDDIDTGNDLYCSRLQVNLTPGTYHLRVRAFGASGFGGLYGLAGGRVG